MKTVVGVFDGMEQARDVVGDLLQEGFQRDDISLVASDPEGRYAAELDHNEIPGDSQTATADAVKGGMLGGIGGLLVGLAIMAIPGVGPVLAAGPMLGLLTGVATTGGVGAVVGALVGGGVLVAESGFYAEAVRNGNVLVGVQTPEEQVERVVVIMNRHNSLDIAKRTEELRARGWGGSDLNVEPDSAF